MTTHHDQAADEAEYWRQFHMMRNELAGAVRSNHVYLTINNLVLSENEVGLKLNEHGDFWQLNAVALQTTFFIAFGKLFDPRRGTVSIPRVLDATIARPHLFAKEALRERKRKDNQIVGPDPKWLVDYMKTAWEPTEQDLALLKGALKPHQKKFKHIYQPIRHRFYAHRSDEDEKSIADLFAKTRISEIDEILGFLHTLIWEIQDLYQNGRKPNLSNFDGYKGYVTEITRNTEEFVHQLVR
jgi:hypothetical protein